MSDSRSDPTDGLEASEGLSLAPLRDDYQQRNPSEGRADLALHTVRRQLMEQYAQRSASPRPAARTWAFALSGMAAAAAAVAFFWLQAPPALPKLGFSKAVKLAQQRDGSVQIEIPEGQRQGRVSGEHWSLIASTHTRARIRRKGPASVSIQLEEGMLSNAITPRTMKRYEVATQGLRVVVTGTRFSIEKQARWVRVEVTRGQVQLRDPQGKRLGQLEPTQGLRLDLQSGAFKRYALPPYTPCKGRHCWMDRRLSWLQKKQPSQYYAYVRDLATNRRFPKDKRLSWLEESIDFAKLRKAPATLRLKFAFRLYSLAPAAGRGNALYAAMRACRDWKRQPKGSSPPLCPRALSLYAANPTPKDYVSLARSLWKHFSSKPLPRSLQK